MTHEWPIDALYSLAESPTSRFTELVRRAGLDPLTDFRWADLTGADLRGEDLRRFDLRNANLSGALVAGAKFNDTVSVDQLVHADASLIAQIVIVGDRSAQKFGFLSRQIGSNYCVSLLGGRSDDPDANYLEFSRRFSGDVEIGRRTSLVEVKSIAEQAALNIVVSHISDYNDLELVFELYKRVRGSVNNRSFCVFIVHGAKDPEGLGEVIQRKGLLPLRDTMVWFNGVSIGRTSDMRSGGSGGIDAAVGELTDLFRFAGLRLGRMFSAQWPQFRVSKAKKSTGAVRLFRADPADMLTVLGDSIVVNATTGRKVQLYISSEFYAEREFLGLVDLWMPTEASVTGIPKPHGYGKCMLVVAEEDSTIWNILEPSSL